MPQWFARKASLSEALPAHASSALRMPASVGMKSPCVHRCRCGNALLPIPAHQCSLLTPSCLPATGSPCSLHVPAFRFPVSASQFPCPSPSLHLSVSLSLPFSPSLSLSFHLCLSLSLPLPPSLSLSASFSPRPSLSVSLCLPQFFFPSTLLSWGTKQHIPCVLNENLDTVGISPPRLCLSTGLYSAACSSWSLSVPTINGSSDGYLQDCTGSASLDFCL